MGGPVAIRVGNTEWPKWEKVMAGDPERRYADSDAHRPPGNDAEAVADADGHGHRDPDADRTSDRW
jgi:chorismate synthase